MSVCFFAPGPIEWASARYRAYWPAKYMTDAQVVQYNEVARDNFPLVDTAIWGKYINLEVMAIQKAAGQRVIWDLCDPMWWQSPGHVREALQYVDGLTFSSPLLMDDFHEWHGNDRPMRYIADRFELSHFNHYRTHTKTTPVRFIWFGIAANRIALYGAFTNLLRLHANGYQVALTIMDELPNRTMPEIEGQFPIHYTRWALDREVRELAQHDIALLPPYPGPWGEVKSSNKAQMANLCGLPVTKGDHYPSMVRLMDWRIRDSVAYFSRGVSTDDFNVRDSATEWETFINELPRY